MAKLPGFESLGPAQVAGGRPVGSYDVSPLRAAGAAIAHGLQTAGQGVAAVGGDIADVNRKYVESKAFDAHAGAASELLNLHSDLQKSKDYANLDTQYSDAAGKIVDKWAQTIPDGRLREHYLASQGEAVARGAASVSNMAFHGMASTDADVRKATLEDIEAKIGEDPGNSFLPDAMKGLGLRVDKAVDAGWITKEHGDLEKRNAAVKIAIRTNEVEYAQDPTGWLDKHGYAPRQSKAALLAGITKAATDNGISPESAARVIQIESGGNPNARTGSYHGLTQLSQSEFAKYNKTPGASIYDPDANMQAGFAKMRAEGDQFTAATGKQPSDFDRYMIHQQGLAGYQAHLGNPNAPAWQNMLSTGEGKQKGEGWAKAAIWGNIPDQYKRQFGSVDNVTSADFLKMWGAKYGTSAPNFQETGAGPVREDGSGFHMIDPLTRMKMVNQARTIAQQQANDTVARDNLAINQRSQDIERLLIDAAAGHGAMPPREMIENDPLLAGNEAHRNTLLKQWDHANKQDEAFQSAFARFQDPNAGPFNQVNDDDKKQVDKIYQALVNGDPEREIPTLQRVVDRTGIVPASAASAMRGAMVSGSAPRVLQAVQTARNLLANNPQIFTGVTGGPAIEAAAVSYKQYTEDFGYTPEQAAQKIVQDNDPENKAKLAARIKNEDVGDIVKKQLAIGDLEKAFNESWRGLGGRTTFGGPNVEFTEGAKATAFSDYAELFKSKYMETGNVDTAKAQAIDQMKKIWGVSYLNGTGSGTLMRYPPERVPAYAGIPDLVDKIAGEAVEAIKSQAGPSGPQLEAGAPAGEAVTRDKIILTPAPGGQTAQAYMSGQNVPYLLSWFDKDGHLQMLNPGKAFVFDGQKARAGITEERRVGLEKAVQGTAAMTEALAQPNALGSP